MYTSIFVNFNFPLNLGPVTQAAPAYVIDYVLIYEYKNKISNKSHTLCNFTIQI